MNNTLRLIGADYFGQTKLDKGNEHIIDVEVGDFHTAVIYENSKIDIIGFYKITKLYYYLDPMIKVNQT